MPPSGRQLGAEGLDQFRHTKLVVIDPAANDQDFWWFPYAERSFPVAATAINGPPASVSP